MAKLSRSEIIPGDHIFTYKSGSGHDHDHHGIYVAENQVIHFTLQRNLVQAQCLTHLFRAMNAGFNRDTE
ncbi:hypothetical protein SUGI_0254870 [Cryptomeria japonica]|nr:hypothetical protein SUGI_0254870 [Cryptomeria japonica]